jgi:hypothetical protein
VCKNVGCSLYFQQKKGVVFTASIVHQLLFLSKNLGYNHHNAFEGFEFYNFQKIKFKTPRGSYQDKQALLELVARIS